MDVTPVAERPRSTAPPASQSYEPGGVVTGRGRDENRNILFLIISETTMLRLKWISASFVVIALSLILLPRCIRYMHGLELDAKAKEIASYSNFQDAIAFLKYQPGSYASHDLFFGIPDRRYYSASVKIAHDATKEGREIHSWLTDHYFIVISRNPVDDSIHVYVAPTSKEVQFQVTSTRF